MASWSACLSSEDLEEEALDSLEVTFESSEELELEDGIVEYGLSGD